MAAIVTSIEVDRPAEDVFAYATDPTRFPEWQQGVVSGHMETSGPPTVGATCHTTRRIGGPIRAIVEVTVEPLDAGRSHLTIRVDFTRPRHRKDPGPPSTSASAGHPSTTHGTCGRVGVEQLAWGTMVR